MGFQLIRLVWLIVTFHIHRPRGLIKSVPAIKKQHQLVMVMPRQFRAHLNRLRELLRIRYSIILDRQYSMCKVGGARLELGDQFWRKRPHTIVGSKNSTINSKDPRDIDPNVYNQRLQVVN